MPEVRRVQTVLGPVAPEDLGYTLMHEHLSSNLVLEYRGNGLLNDPSLVADELGYYAGLGGATVVDCTSVGLGRNPRHLAQIAEASGVQVVMGSGFYRDPYHDPRLMNENSVSELADMIVRDLTHGVDGTEIRSGIIGEVGCDKWFASAFEERAFRAAGRAHLRTGVPITTHAARWPVGRVQLDILEQEGVDPAHVIIGHSDWQVDGEKYHLDLARAGAYVQFDTLAHAMGRRDFERTASYVVNLIDHGYLDRILLSHDICLRNQFQAFGGPGFTLILEAFTKTLYDHGVEPVAFQAMMVENPRRALTPTDPVVDAP
jgi:phosphotriesterase-related protein